MRSKLLRFGLVCIVVAGVLLSVGDSLNSVYQLGGDVNTVRSTVTSVFLVIGFACVILFFVKSIMTILFVLLLAIAVFFVLRYGLMNLFF